MKKFSKVAVIFFSLAFFWTIMVYQAYIYKSSQNDYCLLVENPHKKDLIHQPTIDKVKNSTSLKTPLKIIYYDVLQLVEIEFPTEFENITGTIQFYSPLNKKEELSLPIDVGGDKYMNVFIHSLKSGTWKIEVAWVGDGIPFLDKHMIEIPTYVPDKLITDLTD